MTYAQTLAAAFVGEAKTAQERADLLDACEVEYAWALQHGTEEEALHEGAVLAAVRAMLAQAA